MRHTLTAVFDDRGDAQHALNKLLAAGFLQADTTLSLATPAGQAGRAREGVHGLGMLTRHLLAHLPGTGSAPRRANDAGSNPGRHLLTLTTGSEVEADRAIGLVGRFVFADGDPGRPIERVSNTTRTFYPPGTEPGALQNHARGNSHYFGTRGADDIFPLGTTFRAASSSATQWERNDDGADNPAPAGAQAPPGWRLADEIAAKRYGNAMHLSEKYRNRAWNEVDREIKSGWELRDPAAPGWDAYEAAIHRGWDEASPDIDEDSYYRTHWNVQYADKAGGNRDHASVAGSGSKSRDGFQYRVRHWTAVAAGRKASWAARHVGELPPWERFKDAVLHGWGRISLGNDDKGGGYPAHGAGNSTDSDDPSPAFRYGDEMAHAGQSSGLVWEDAENALRDAWDSRYGGRGFASWDRNKAAVRRGWERTTPSSGASER